VCARARPVFACCPCATPPPPPPPTHPKPMSRLVPLCSLMLWPPTLSLLPPPASLLLSSHPPLGAPIRGPYGCHVLLRFRLVSAAVRLSLALWFRPRSPPHTSFSLPPPCALLFCHVCCVCACRALVAHDPFRPTPGCCRGIHPFCGFAFHGNIMRRTQQLSIPLPPRPTPPQPPIPVPCFCPRYCDPLATRTTPICACTCFSACACVHCLVHHVFLARVHALFLVAFACPGL